MIYFIQACGGDNLIKIGVSRAPAERLSSLLTASPVDLKLLLVTLGGRSEERALHVRFASARVRGEWFFPCRPLLDHIASAHADNPQRSDAVDLSMSPKRWMLAPGKKVVRVMTQQEKRERTRKAEQEARAKVLAAEIEIRTLKQKQRLDQKERQLRELAFAFRPTPILPFPPLTPERMTPELEELMRQAEAFRELGRR